MGSLVASRALRALGSLGGPPPGPWGPGSPVGPPGWPVDPSSPEGPWAPSRPWVRADHWRGLARAGWSLPATHESSDPWDPRGLAGPRSLDPGRSSGQTPGSGSLGSLRATGRALEYSGTSRALRALAPCRPGGPPPGPCGPGSPVGPPVGPMDPSSPEGPWAPPGLGVPASHWRGLAVPVVLGASPGPQPWAPRGPCGPVAPWTPVGPPVGPISLGGLAGHWRGLVVLAGQRGLKGLGLLGVQGATSHRGLAGAWTAPSRSSRSGHWVLLRLKGLWVPPGPGVQGGPLEGPCGPGSPGGPRQSSTPWDPRGPCGPVLAGPGRSSGGPMGSSRSCRATGKGLGDLGDQQGLAGPGLLAGQVVRRRALRPGSPSSPGWAVDPSSPEGPWAPCGLRVQGGPLEGPCSSGSPGGHTGPQPWAPRGPCGPVGSLDAGGSSGRTDRALGSLRATGGAFGPCGPAGPEGPWAPWGPRGPPPGPCGPSHSQWVSSQASDSSPGLWVLAAAFRCRGDHWRGLAVLQVVLPVHHHVAAITSTWLS